jgi:protein O-GlcNAc transferase
MLGVAENVTLAEAVRRGMEHHRAGRLAEAEGIYREILSQAPDEPEVLHLLGYLAFQVQRYDVAVELISRAIALNPHKAKFYDNLGNALRMIGRPADAIAAQTLALELDPADYEARSNLAVAYMTSRQFAQAERHFRQVLAEHPELAEVWNNLGGALRELRRINESVAAFERAIALKPDLAEAHNNLASALSSQGRQEEAVREYRRSIELRPGHFSGHSNLLLSMHYLPEVTPEEIFEEHSRWATVHGAASRDTGILPVRSGRHGLEARVTGAPPGKIRIGYISADFYGHVVSYFIEPLLREHDREKFEIYCYADLANLDGTSERLLSLANEHRLITGMRTHDVAELIRRDGIDILVDLGGHTWPNNLKVLALKSAPVQGTYLGYPNTTGLTTVDYRITDSIADPPGWTEKYHTEKLWRLPRCAWCFRPQTEARDIPAASIEPPDQSRPVTFGSFNTLAKVTPWVIELWSDVLKAVSGSRLLIKAYTLADEETKARLRDAFASFGIDASRLALESHQRLYVDHLNLYRQVDIALDTSPYNGTTTTCVAMWMGVPVIHLAGKTHVSCVGASLLHAVGLDDLSASTREEYIATAARLAKDQFRLKEIRSSLRDKMQRSELMDESGLARAIEGAYRAMWESACQTP